MNGTVFNNICTNSNSHILYGYLVPHSSQNYFMCQTQFEKTRSLNNISIGFDSKHHFTKYFYKTLCQFSLIS